MNEEYRLQLLSHGEIFPTREEALEYIEDNFKGYAKWAEPALFFYGTEREPKMILAFGASKTSTRPRVCIIDDAELREMIATVEELANKNAEDIAKTTERLLNVINVVGLTLDENKIVNQVSYDPDPNDELIRNAETVADAIAIISTFVQEKLKEFATEFVDTKSVAFTQEQTATGTTVKADVKISTEGDDDDLEFNNNIVGIKPDGVFASCNIEYDAERNRLIFTTSGMKNGRFVTDANKKIIDFGAHTIYTADNEGHTINVIINQERGTISADAKISENEDNILTVVDGKLNVDGRAKYIKFQNTTVAAKLVEFTNAINEIQSKIAVLDLNDLIVGDESDSILTRAIKNPNGGYTITADSRFGSDNSIVIANGGLSANIDVEVDTAANKLVLKVGNVNKAVTLPGVSIIDNIYYDAANKAIVITWKDGSQQTVIPVGDMLKTWDVYNNPSSAVTLTKSSPATGPELLSAEVKIRTTDNLLGKTSGGELFVNKSEIDNAIAVVQNAVTTETNARIAADSEINASVANVSASLELTNTNLANEVTRATTAEGEIAADVASLGARVTTAEENVTQAVADAAAAMAQVELTNANLEAEVRRAQTAEGVISDDVTSLTSRMTTAEGQISQAFADAADAKAIAEQVDTKLTAEVNRAQTAEANLAADINEIDTQINSLEGELETEKLVRATTDTAQDERIATLQSGLASAESTHNADIVRLTGQITQNSNAISTLNGPASQSGSVLEAMENAKTYASNLVSNETSRAEAAEQANTTAILNEVVRAQGAEAQVLADAKAYTNTTVEYSKHLSDDYTDEAKRTAIAESKAYTDEKIAQSGSGSTAYTDEKVAAEQARAEAAEQANAADIIALKAKDVQIDAALATKVESVTVVKSTASDLQYILKVDGVDAGEINIPEDQFLKSVDYDDVSKKLRFVFETSEGEKTVVIDIADLVDTYNAGDGLSIENNTFSVKINPASEFLTVDANGIKVSGINAALATKANSNDVYTKTEADAKFITEHQDLSGLDSRITANEGAIAIINGNEAQTGSIKKAEADAKLYADTKVAAEAEARQAADALKANASDVYTKAEADAKFITEHQDLSALATKAELTSEVNRATAAEQANADEIVALKAKDVQIDEALDTKVESVTLVKGDTDLVYRLMVDGQEKGVINIPEDQFLKSVTYSPATKELTFTFITREGEKVVVIGVDDLVDTYTAGDGLKVVNNQFSVLINEDTESYLTITGEGLKLVGIDAALATKANSADVYTKTQIDNMGFITEHQSLADYAKKNEVTALDTKVETYNTNLTTAVTANTADIATLNANALVEGSVDNKVKIAKDDLESQINLKANAADVYTKAQIDSKGFITEHQDISGLATKVEFNAAVDYIETELAKKIESVSVQKNSGNDLQYIVTVDGTTVGTIDIPKDQFIREVHYDAGNKAIVFTFVTETGDEVVSVSVADLVDTYTAGNGLKLENNQFSVLINEDSEAYLSLTAEGLKLAGIDAALAAKANSADVYTKAEADATFLTEHQDISNLATKAELAPVSAKADANESAIAVINGNEAQDGSIKKALADAKAYADGIVATETSRATAAEQTNADAITIINGNEAQTGSIKKAEADAKAYADSLIASEAQSRIAADNVINDALATKANAENVYTKSQIDEKGYLTASDIANKAEKSEVTAEATRAQNAEAGLSADIAQVNNTLTASIADTNANVAENASDIAALQAESRRLNLIVDETNSVKLTKSKDDTGTELSADVKLDITSSNILKITGNGLTADVEMSYSQATNTITFSNGLSTQEFQLAGASLIEDGYYNSTTKQIVLVTRLADGTTKEIKIDAEALIHTLKVDNGTNNPIKLAKTTDSEGVDVLSARLDISTERHNLILNNNGTLYASNQAENHTALWNGTEMTLQEVLELLKTEAEAGSEAAEEIAEIKEDLHRVELDVANMESSITSLDQRVSNNATAIATNAGAINTLSTQVSDLNGRVTTMSTEFNELKNTVESYDGRMTAIENDNVIIKDSVSTLSTTVQGLATDVSTINQKLGDISTTNPVSARLEALENDDVIDNGGY